MGASALMAGAVGSFNDGLRGLDKLREEAKTANTQAILDHYQSYGSVEELAAARESGALDQALGGIQGEYDKDAVRGAFDARMKALMESQTLSNAYNDDVRDRQEAHLKDRYLGLIASGDREGANKILAEHELRNEGALTIDGEQAYRGYQSGVFAQNSEQRAAVRHNQTTEAHNANMAWNNETRAWERTARGREEAEREQLELAENTVHEFIAGTAQDDIRTINHVKTMAEDMGLPLDRDGMPDKTRMTPEQSQMLNDGMEAWSTKEGIRTDTEREEILRKILANKGIKPSVINKAATFYGQQLTIDNTPAATDIARRDQELAQVDSSLAAAHAGNPFVEPKENPFKTANSTLQFLRDKDWDNGNLTNLFESNSDSAKQLVKDVVGMSKRGVDIDGKNYRVTPQIIEAVITSLQEKPTASALRKGVKEFLQQPELIKAHDDYEITRREADLIKNQIRGKYQKNSTKRHSTLQKIRSY